jgi:hypothetical protein
MGKNKKRNSIYTINGKTINDFVNQIEKDSKKLKDDILSKIYSHQELYPLFKDDFSKIEVLFNKESNLAYTGNLNFFITGNCQRASIYFQKKDLDSTYRVIVGNIKDGKIIQTKNKIIEQIY